MAGSVGPRGDGEGEDDWQQRAEQLRARVATRRAVCVVGSGLAGLACAERFASCGFAICVVCGEEAPGQSGPASAAASLLDPLTPKGKPMWRGTEAFDDAIASLNRAGEAPRPPRLQAQLPILHVAGSSKAADALRAAATEHTEAAASAEGVASAASAGVRYLESGHAELARDASGASLPHGGLLCYGVSVDTASYLRSLWAAVQRATAASWVCRRLARVGPVAAAFDCVVIAAGAGCGSIDETRHLPLELCRGQVLELAPPGLRPAPPAATDGAQPADGAAPEAPLGMALVGSGCYILPRGGALVCGGTHEDAGADGSRPAPADAEAAARLLMPRVTALYPPAAASAPPRAARAGVRALPPRSPAGGSIPLAGRAHSQPGQANVWFATGLGARGLLYHSALAKWIVGAAVAALAAKDRSEACPEACRHEAGLEARHELPELRPELPVELRRGEWAQCVSERLERWLERGAARTYLNTKMHNFDS